jgi:hypothetical protein
MDAPGGLTLGVKSISSYLRACRNVKHNLCILAGRGPEVSRARRAGTPSGFDLAPARCYRGTVSNPDRFS